jgi:cytochrome b6-f complex iron-sulfur subunit
MTDNRLPVLTKRKPSRREFLALAWLASLGALTIKFGDILARVALPRRKAGEFGGVFDLGELSALPEPSGAPLLHRAGRFWLVHQPEGLIALHKACTHLDCLIDWNAQEGKFLCPCHGSQFARDGRCLGGPAQRDLDRFVVQLADPQGKLLVETDLASGAPLAPPQPGAPAPIATFPADASDPAAAALPDLNVLVDTGRKISGAPAQDSAGL